MDIFSEPCRQCSTSFYVSVLDCWCDSSLSLPLRNGLIQGPMCISFSFLLFSKILCVQSRFPSLSRVPESQGARSASLLRGGLCRGLMKVYFSSSFICLRLCLILSPLLSSASLHLHFCVFLFDCPESLISSISHFQNISFPKSLILSRSVYSLLKRSISAAFLSPTFS